MPGLRLALMLFLLSGTAIAQGEADLENDARRVALQLQNPVSDQANFRLQGNVDQGLGERQENRLLGKIELLMPIRVLHDWNVVVESSLELKSLPAIDEGLERLNGLGDMTVHLRVAPAQPGSWIWGLGPVMRLPTETSVGLGSGRFSLGPSLVVEYQGEHWTLGFKANHLHSVTGATERDQVELTSLQPILSYVTGTGVVIGLTSESVYNWDAPRGQRWTLPLQVNLSKVSIVGRTPIELLMGGGYFALAPPDGPDWSVRVALTVILSVLRVEPTE